MTNIFRWSLLAIAIATLPLSAAQSDIEDAKLQGLRASASNQRVDLTWDPVPEAGTSYAVRVFQNGEHFTNRTTQTPQVSFLLTNGQTYVFQVAAVAADGTQGPWSDPVAATPRLENDLAYLAAGLIAVWLGLLGYAAFLARKEASIDEKLDRILQARFEGRSP